MSFLPRSSYSSAFPPAFEIRFVDLLENLENVVIYAPTGMMDFELVYVANPPDVVTNAILL